MCSAASGKALRGVIAAQSATSKTANKMSGRARWSKRRMRTNIERIANRRHHCLPAVLQQNRYRSLNAFAADPACALPRSVEPKICVLNAAATRLCEAIAAADIAAPRNTFVVIVSDLSRKYRWALLSLKGPTIVRTL